LFSLSAAASGKILFKMNFKTDESILIPARVVRQRGRTVEAQLSDGALIRVDERHVERVPEKKPAREAVNKAIRMGEAPAGTAAGRK
jgi:hypothetical protein